MGIGRRLAILGATVASAISLAPIATPASASASPRDHDRGLQTLTNVLQPVDPYDPEWVNVRWTTDRKVCHVRVKAYGERDVEVVYPSDRRYTSFSQGEGLRPGRVDYTSFQVTVRENGPGWEFLRVTVDYDYCHGNSPTLNDAIGFWLPVRA